MFGCVMVHLRIKTGKKGFTWWKKVLFKIIWAKKRKNRRKEELKLLKMYRTYVKSHGKMYLSRKSSITFPAVESLTVILAVSGLLFIGLTLESYAVLSCLRHPGRWASVPGVWVPISDVCFISKTAEWILVTLGFSVLGLTSYVLDKYELI